MTLAPHQLHQGDCIDLLAKLDAGSVNLVFADPPFNIGYEYDVYHDRKADHEYLAWSKKWISGVHRALAHDGTFWLAIGDEYAAELKWIATREIGFYCRSWVIWYYTFGVNCTRKFNRSHVHLFHFVKDADHFTFRADDPAVRVPSARQLVYADGRANPHGRLPDDTWILRPQDLPQGFQPTDDTWYFPRVAGTFKERAGFHGCQMPERLLARIILVSSAGGDCVLDPFAGSGSTLAVAKKLGRSWMGFELSKDYVRLVRARLGRINVGDPLDGVADPITSAPPTPKKNNVRRRVELPVQAAARRATTKFALEYSVKTQHFEQDQTRQRLSRARIAAKRHPSEDEKKALIRAFRASHQGFSADSVLANPVIASAFGEACRQEGLPGSLGDWNRSLLNLRKQKSLPRCTKRQAKLREEEVDGFIFASEIALQSLMSQKVCTLDDILCDPELGCEFDEFARRLAPGYEPFHYRLGALRVRKRGRDKKKNIELLTHEDRNRRFSNRVHIDDLVSRFRRKDQGGLYLLEETGIGRTPLYVGETLSLATRLSSHRASDRVDFGQCHVRFIGIDGWPKCAVHIRGANQAWRVERHSPRFNYLGTNVGR